MRSAVAVALFQSAVHQSIRALVGCYRSMSDSEVESRPEALRLAVGYWRSKVERQYTAREHGQQVSFPQPIRYHDMAAYHLDGVYGQ